MEGDLAEQNVILATPIISIHALRVEGDKHQDFDGKYCTHNFYPRPPGGGRPRPSIWRGAQKGISIHALRVEGDAITTR